jgi:hypothetical protein
MGEGLVSSLFNRAILDSIVGFALLIIVEMMGTICADTDLLQTLEKSSAGSWAIVIIVAASFTAGTAIDRLAFQLLDRRMFGKYFVSRHAGFDVPPRVMREIDNEIYATTSREAGGGILDAPLVHDSRADAISAIFWTKARPEALSKRADLIANFQFNSNLLIVGLLGVVVFPFWGHEKKLSVLVVLVVTGSLLAASVPFWRASIAAISSIHTLENVIVFGIFLDGWRPLNAQDQKKNESLTGKGRQSRSWRKTMSSLRNGRDRLDL